MKSSNFISWMMLSMFFLNKQRYEPEFYFKMCHLKEKESSIYRIYPFNIILMASESCPWFNWATHMMGNVFESRIVGFESFYQLHSSQKFFWECLLYKQRQK